MGFFENLLGGMFWAGVQEIDSHRRNMEQMQLRDYAMQQQMRHGPPDLQQQLGRIVAVTPNGIWQEQGSMPTVRGSFDSLLNPQGRFVSDQHMLMVRLLELGYKGNNGYADNDEAVYFYEKYLELHEFDNALKGGK